MILKTLKDLKCCNIFHRCYDKSPTEENCHLRYKDIEKLFKIKREILVYPEKIFDIPITRIRELIDVFMKNGFNIKNDEDWKELKRHFFNITEELRQEAIKWIKEYYSNLKEGEVYVPKINIDKKSMFFRECILIDKENGNIFPKNELDISDFKRHFGKSVLILDQETINFIKHFFNITDEDLE